MISPTPHGAGGGQGQHFYKVANVGGSGVVWAGGITKLCGVILATLYMCGCGFGLAVGG